MKKCVLIYLWIYIGLFYMIEAGDDDEHVHIKLHMTSGQRKRAQIKQHHKKRHSPPPSGSHHHHHHHSHPQPPPPPATTTTNLYHESPHNYLAGITSTSSSLVPQQHHVFEHTAGHSIKKFPSSSSPLHLHESGQLLNMDEELYGQGDVGGGGDDTEAGEPVLIPSYLTKSFASFPQPTTTYETEIIPHNSEGFNVVEQGLTGLDELEEDNEITAPTGRGAGSLESIILAEQIENYQRHKPPSPSSSSASSSSAKTIKNEQLLQQLLQQHHNYNDEEPEIMNAAAYKSAKLRGNKYRAEKDYHSEDDMTEGIVYSSGRHPTHTISRPFEDVPYRGSIKTLTVNDIWSQLQQQYLSKYTPQAQSIIIADSEEQPLVTTTSKTKTKRKRNTKRPKHARPTTTAATYATSWPAKALSYSNSNHHKNQPKLHHQHYYDVIHTSPSASAFSSGTSLSSYHRNTDLSVKRPFNKFTAHDDEDDTAETDEDGAALFSEAGDEDDVDAYGDNADNNHDESLEEAIYQRGKKYAGHAVYGQHTHTNNPFNYHDLFGSSSTPITATVATNLQPYTYHPNHSVSSTLPSYTASSKGSFLPTISHPSTSYQWRTQQNYPASYQTYLLQHQPHWTAAAATSGEEPYAQQQQQSSALRLPKATFTHTANTVLSSKLSPTQSNDFTASTSSSSSSAASSSSASTSSAKTTAQTPTRYKKRKNRIKAKRNRIVVLS